MENTPIVAQDGPSREPITTSPPPTQLLKPTLLPNGLEVSVHQCPRLMVRELKHVFPGPMAKPSGTAASDDEETLAILTCQQAGMDLTNFGEEADTEKDRLLETFMQWAQKLSKKLAEKGYWCDYIDPCSGLPMLTTGCNNVYSEVDGMQLLLRYRCLNAGMCKILLHPEWGSAVYPASMFAKAPFEVVKQAIEEDM